MIRGRLETFHRTDFPNSKYQILFNFPVSSLQKSLLLNFTVRSDKNSQHRRFKEKRIDLRKVIDIIFRKKQFSYTVSSALKKKYFDLQQKVSKLYQEQRNFFRNFFFFKTQSPIKIAPK